MTTDDVAAMGLAMGSMATEVLVALKNDADARLRDIDKLMKATLAATLAYDAMTESRPGLLAFRNAIMYELANRGA